MVITIQKLKYVILVVIFLIALEKSCHGISPRYRQIRKVQDLELISERDKWYGNLSYQTDVLFIVHVSC